MSGLQYLLESLGALGHHFGGLGVALDIILKPLGLILEALGLTLDLILEALGDMQDTWGSTLRF